MSKGTGISEADQAWSGLASECCVSERREVPCKRIESSSIVIEGRRSTVSAVLPHISEQTGGFGSRPKQRDGLAADGEEGHVEPSCRLRYRTLAQGRRLDVGRSAGRGERRERPVVDDQHVGSRQPSQEPRVGAVRAREFELLKQTRRSPVDRAVTLRQALH